MDFDIYTGAKGLKYYVYDGASMEKAIDDVARMTHRSPYELKVITVWISGDDLYLERVDDAVMRFAVVRR